MNTTLPANREHLSPNHYPASYFKDKSILVIHATAADTWNSTKHWFKNPQSKASSHYVVDKNGDIYQMVDEAYPAWHAGISRWNGKTDLNRHSIGIEIVNNSIKPYPEEQIQAVIKLSADIMRRNGITSENLVRHSDISGFRGKRDPYSHFPWDRFKQSVVSMVGSGVVLPGPGMPGTVPAGTVSPWAEDAWEFAKQTGMVDEDSDPQKPTTKEEVATMIYRFYDKVINN